VNDVTYLYCCVTKTVTKFHTFVLLLKSFLGIKFKTMKQFSIDSFATGFQVIAIVLLFGYSTSSTNDQSKENFINTMITKFPVSDKVAFDYSSNLITYNENYKPVLPAIHIMEGDYLNITGGELLHTATVKYSNADIDKIKNRKTNICY
jgi:hypothetical protein